MRQDKLLLTGLALLSFLCGFVSEPVVIGQEQTNSPVQRTESLQTKVLDLVFRIEDLGGKVQDLQIKETGQEVRIELAADVLFDFDKADILPKAQAALKQAGELIRDKAKGAVRIEGHTDAKGSDPYNQKLSERRAQAVKTWLTDKEGLTNAEFSIQGFGAKKPVAPNKSRTGPMIRKDARETAA